MNWKIEIKNTQRLLNDCYKSSNGSLTPKTKTAHLIDCIKSPTYERKTCEELQQCTKHETKTIIIARFGMLECGQNFKGSMNSSCRACKVVDDESHRLNDCILYRTQNGPVLTPHVNFDDIYSSDHTVLSNVMSSIERLWNTKTAHRSIKP